MYISVGYFKTLPFSEIHIIVSTDTRREIGERRSITLFERLNINIDPMHMSIDKS